MEGRALKIRNEQVKEIEDIGGSFFYQNTKSSSFGELKKISNKA